MCGCIFEYDFGDINAKEIKCPQCRNIMLHHARNGIVRLDEIAAENEGKSQKDSGLPVIGFVQEEEEDEEVQDDNDE